MADNQIVSAWRELRLTQNEVMAEGATPRNPRITVDGTTVPCVLGENSDDPAFMGGGIGNEGSMTLQTALEDWGGNIPEKPEIATVFDMALATTEDLQVISTVERNGILYVLVGDNSTQ